MTCFRSGTNRARHSRFFCRCRCSAMPRTHITTGYEKINSPIEVIERYQQQPHLHQEILSSRGNQTEDPDRNIITDTANRPTNAAYSEPPPTYEIGTCCMFPTYSVSEDQWNHQVSLWILRAFQLIPFLQWERETGLQRGQSSI